MSAHRYDYDWLIVGSGFGGSVSAMRLTEKGYSVGMLECGRRFEDKDFVKTTWNVWRYYWVPKLRMKGILRMTLFNDIMIVSGCGVGGGSLGYANTLYRPSSAFYQDPIWRDLDDWEEALRPCFDKAEHMLGVDEYRGEGPADELLRDLSEELGVAETYHHTRIGVFFNDEAPGQTVPDPYFGGEGPDRAGCIRCGACMPGCRYNAKNTLPKNYLFFAERNGARVHPERTVVDVRPLGAGYGSDGYEVTSDRSGRTSCCRPAGTTAHSRGSPTASATGCAPTASRSPPSRSRTIGSTSRSRWRSPRASTRARTPTSRT